MLVWRCWVCLREAVRSDRLTNENSPFLDFDGARVAVSCDWLRGSLDSTTLVVADVWMISVDMSTGWVDVANPCESSPLMPVLIEEVWRPEVPLSVCVDVNWLEGMNSPAVEVRSNCGWKIYVIFCWKTACLRCVLENLHVNTAVFSSCENIGTMWTRLLNWWSNHWHRWHVHSCHWKKNNIIIVTLQNLNLSQYI